MQPTDPVSSEATDTVKHDNTYNPISEYTGPTVPISSFLARMLMAAGRRNNHRDISQPNFRGDGYDQTRLDAAEAKRKRRAERNLARRT